MRVSVGPLRLDTVQASTLITAQHEYSLGSPSRTMVTFTWFDGGAGAATTGAGGGGGATGFTGSGMMRPISRSLMRRLGSPSDSVGRLRIKDSLPDIRGQQNLLRLFPRDLQRDCPGN